MLTNFKNLGRHGVSALNPHDLAEMDHVAGGFGVMEIAAEIMPYVVTAAVVYWNYQRLSNDAAGRAAQRAHCQRLVNNFTEGALEDLFYLIKGTAALPSWVRDRWNTAWNNINGAATTTNPCPGP